LLAEIREKQLQDELTTKAEARKWARERLKEGTDGTHRSRSHKPNG